MVGEERGCPYSGEMAELVEGTRLEIERGSDVTVGSNPTLSVDSSVYSTHFCDLLTSFFAFK